MIHEDYIIVTVTKISTNENLVIVHIDFLNCIQFFVWKIRSVSYHEHTQSLAKIRVIAVILDDKKHKIGGQNSS